MWVLWLKVKVGLREKVILEKNILKIFIYLSLKYPSEGKKCLSSKENLKYLENHNIPSKDEEDLNNKRVVRGQVMGKKAGI